MKHSSQEKVKAKKRRRKVRRSINTERDLLHHHRVRAEGRALHQDQEEMRATREDIKRINMTIIEGEEDL